MAKEQKDEKIQVLLSTEDFEELSKKISKQALTKGDPPVSISHYVRKLIRRDLGRATED
jgi:predicted nucleic acid-binding protein